MKSVLGLDDPETILRSIGPQIYGSIAAIDGARLSIAGLAGIARIGDRLMIERSAGGPLPAEVIGVNAKMLVAYAFGPPSGASAGDSVLLDRRSAEARPSRAWIGSTLNWRGARFDGTEPARGSQGFPLDASPPPAPWRKKIGRRLSTGHAAFDTFLPLCRGQRIGLFAGSGIGKSMLLGGLSRNVDADVCVIALIGERGREVRAFVEDTLGAEGMARSIVIASTSDESALAKREGARLAMTVAEYFRTQGDQVLLIFDSLTRFAEAHREVALAGGEPPSLHAFPPSTFNAIASLAERAGPGIDGEGDITAIFSVLVAGSDMEEPVADMVRGILDGHVILERKIAERGRFPAIDVRRSVSRSLPAAASASENALLADARALLSAYEESELIIRAGLYTKG
ncbi:MAG: FliI/YscN family ATPase, partial [Pseudomonadota bacterium]